MTGRRRERMKPFTNNNRRRRRQRGFHHSYRVYALYNIRSSKQPLPFSLDLLLRPILVSNLASETSETLHRRRLEAREVYFCLASWSVYLSDFPEGQIFSGSHWKVSCSIRTDSREPSVFFHDFRLSVCGERPAMVNPWVGPSFVEASKIPGNDEKETEIFEFWK